MRRAANTLIITDISTARIASSRARALHFINALGRLRSCLFCAITAHFSEGTGL